MEKLDRNVLMAWLEAFPGTDTKEYELLGEDLEELSVEMNAKIETTNNILGRISTKLSGYEPSTSVQPYFAAKGSKLSEWMQTIVDERKTLDAVKTSFVLTQGFATGSSGTNLVATMETVIVEIVSYGGDTSGYQFQFTLHHQGDVQKGKFDTSLKKFTADVVV